MSIVSDGTIGDLAREEVSICFTFEPRGTKKTIEQILRERGIKTGPLKTLCREEADRMAKDRFILSERGALYVFNKDPRGNYSWQPATRPDVLRYYLNNLKRFLN